MKAMSMSHVVRELKSRQDSFSKLPKVHGASSNNWPIRLASNQRPGQCYEADPKSWIPLIQEDIVGHRHRHGEIEPRAGVRTA